MRFSAGVWTMETRSNLPEVSYFHCPDKLCSSVSVILDADYRAVKLCCSLKHVFWLPISGLKRVVPYWPPQDEEELESDSAAES